MAINPWLLMPINLIGITGLFLLKDKKMIAVCLALFLIDTYVCGSVSDWYSQWSFGHRRMLGLTPVVVLGVSAMIARVNQMSKRKFTLIISLILVAWNFAFILQYVLYQIPRVEAPTFKQIFLNKFLLPYILFNSVTS